MDNKYKIRQANENDIDGVCRIYEAIHRQEAKGEVSIGWDPDTYPIRSTAEDALAEDTLFVMTNGDEIVASAVINQKPLEAYADADWQYDVNPDEVGVIHTLVVLPEYGHLGLGRQFVAFFEDYCRSKGWKVARLDTQEKNVRPLHFYPKIGYTLIGIYDTRFQHLPQPIRLALFEKLL